MSARPPALRALLGVPAPAKLNWFLHVLGRRDDGLHALQSVFQFIDWCDEIDFELRDHPAVSREGADGLPDDDLCLRAARALQQHANCRFGVHMRVRKRIPVQAGLGGGSSDAASVLLALNRLWGLGLRRAQLQELGARLGADVPVFVFGEAAFAEGAGERLRALHLPQWRAVVAWPGAGLSTAQVFAHDSLTRNTPARTMEGFCGYLKRELAQDAAAFGARQADAGEANAGQANAGQANAGQAAQRMRRVLAFGANDLQPVAARLLPQLGALERWLEACCGPGAARMSGSGSAMFAPWPHADDDVLPNAPSQWAVRVCRTLRRHPLAHWVAD